MALIYAYRSLDFRVSVGSEACPGVREYCATIWMRNVIVAQYISAALFRQRHVIRRRAPSSRQIASCFAETGFQLL